MISYVRDSAIYFGTLFGSKSDVGDKSLFCLVSRNGVIQQPRENMNPKVYYFYSGSIMIRHQIVSLEMG